MPSSGERPAAGQVLRQTLADLWAAQVMELAAALAFYGVLSLFPLVLAGAALASWVLPAAVVSKQLVTLVKSAVPPELLDVAPWFPMPCRPCPDRSLCRHSVGACRPAHFWSPGHRTEPRLRRGCAAGNRGAPGIGRSCCARGCRPALRPILGQLHTHVRATRPCSHLADLELGVRAHCPVWGLACVPREGDGVRGGGR